MTYSEFGYCELAVACSDSHVAVGIVCMEKFCCYRTSVESVACFFCGGHPAGIRPPGGRCVHCFEPSLGTLSHFVSCLVPIWRWLPGEVCTCGRAVPQCLRRTQSLRVVLFVRVWLGTRAHEDSMQLRMKVWAFTSPKAVVFRSPRCSERFAHDKTQSGVLM